MYFPWIRDVVTLERARVIKDMRCGSEEYPLNEHGEGDTWRGIAYESYEKWHDDHPEWDLGLRGNQFVGRDLCEAAGEQLGDPEWVNW